MKPKRTCRAIPAILWTILLAAALPASAQIEAPDITGDNQPTEVTRPYEYISDQGGFKVTWPSGCGQLKRRFRDPDPDADPFEVVDVYSVTCNQGGEDGRGCSVMSIFNLRNEEGGMAGPPEVIAEVRAQVENFGVKIIDQRPVSRELPSGLAVNGIDLRGAEPAGSGQIWIRGLLHNGDVFILIAWNRAGGLWDDVEYQNFFSSFEPVVE